MSGEKTPTPVRCAYDIEHQSPEHHAACLTYVRHRYKISGPITVIFPGQCGSAQAHPEWDEVHRNSLPVCACGRDRAIFPPLVVEPVATEGLALSGHEPVVVGEEDLLCIRGDSDSARVHYSVAIEDGQLVVESDPITDIGDLLGSDPVDPGAPKVRTAPLSELAALLSGATTALPFHALDAGQNRLVFAVTAIDAATRQATIGLGAGMEAFDPDGDDGEER